MNTQYINKYIQALRVTMPAGIVAITASLSPLHAQIDLDFSPGVADGLDQQATFIDNDTDTEITVGDFFYFDNVGFDAATNTYIDARVSIVDANTEINNVWATADDSLAINIKGNDLKNPYVMFNLSFWESDGILGNLDSSAANAYTIDNLLLQSFDIDRAGSGFSDLFGYSNDNTPTRTILAADTLLDQEGFGDTENYPVPDNITTFSLQQNEDGSFVGKSIKPGAPMEVQEDYAVTMEYDNFQEGNFIWGITGENSGSPNSRGMSLNGSSTPIVDIVAPATPTPTFYAFSALFAGLYFKNRRNR